MFEERRGRLCRTLKRSRYFLAFFFVVAGGAHFVSPGTYLAIMPAVVPWPAAMVALSGAAEIAGGLGLLGRPTRRFAALGLIALLVAVFPANIHAALYGMNLFGWPAPGWLLWVRLAFQPLLVWWVYRACWEEP